MTLEQRKHEAQKAARRIVGYKSVWQINRRAFLAAKPGTVERRNFARALVQAQANIIGWASR